MGVAIIQSRNKAQNSVKGCASPTLHVLLPRTTRTRVVSPDLGRVALSFSRIEAQIGFLLCSEIPVGCQKS